MLRRSGLTVLTRERIVEVPYGTELTPLQKKRKLMLQSVGFSFQITIV